MARTLFALCGAFLVVSAGVVIVHHHWSLLTFYGRQVLQMASDLIRVVLGRNAASVSIYSPALEV
jgi:hypothetical protein